MLDLAQFDTEPEVIYGRQTKTNPKPPFDWFIYRKALYKIE
jgi:hypothetical protein